MRYPILLGALALLVAAPTVQATYPGGNGRIASAGLIGAGGDSVTEALVTLEPGEVGRGRGGVKFLRECAKANGKPEMGSDCDSEYRAPAWAPNGKRLVFDAGASLALVNADKSGFRRLARVSADDGDPAFSPSGRQVAFHGRSAKAQAVFVRGVAGGKARRLAAGASAPDWSVLNRIAYVRRGAIFSVSPKGGARRRLLRGRDPSWSPDGASIAFARANGIYVANSDGSGARRVVRCSSCRTPVFSPDGKLLVIDLKGLRTVRVSSGRLVRRLIEDVPGEIDFSEPAWQPRT
ncbi:MAG: hypothetical protein WKF32_01580 [Thermoleophilaceae bacterium]